MDIFKLSDGEILKTKEVAKALNIAVSTLYTLKDRGLLKSINVGPRRTGYTAGSVKAYLREINEGDLGGIDG